MRGGGLRYQCEVTIGTHRRATALDVGTDTTPVPVPVR